MLQSFLKDTVKMFFFTAYKKKNLHMVKKIRKSTNPIWLYYSELLF